MQGFFPDTARDLVACLQLVFMTLALYDRYPGAIFVVLALWTFAEFGRFSMK